jgi:hypothetical protein
MTAIAFQTKLKSDTVHLPDIDGLIGKDVIITVVEIEKDKPKQKVAQKKQNPLDEMFGLWRDRPDMDLELFVS